MRLDGWVSSCFVTLRWLSLSTILLYGPSIANAQDAGPSEPAPGRTLGGDFDPHAGIPRAPTAEERVDLAVAPQSRAADLAFVLICTMIAYLLTPALGLFYSGMVRRKNALATFQKTFILTGVVTIQWLAIGYSLAFNPEGIGGLVGGFQWAGLSGVGLEPSPDYAPKVPHQLFMAFQLAIAVFAPAVISGAIVERMRFGPFLLFVVLWTTLVYEPIVHWIMAPSGWLNRWGVLDFGGGLSVHLAAGVSALACARVLGKRKGFGTEVLPPHNLLLTGLGTALLGFGWLGWSAGNARGADPSAVSALVATLISAGAAELSWASIEYLYEGRNTGLGMLTGCVAGLVAITPAAGYVGPFGAMAIGAAVSPICYAAMRIKTRLEIDDSLDVFAVNGVGGAVGVIAVGVLALPDDLGSPAGLIYGKADLFLAQSVAVVAVACYSGLVTLGLILAIDRFIGIRVKPDDEELGLDLAHHGERVYILSDRDFVGISARP